jgi:hypothetical protein
VGDEFAPIRAAADIDAAWLTEVFHRAGVGGGCVVADVRSRSIGTGQVGDNVRFELTWNSDADGLPATVIGKFPSQSPVSRSTAVNMSTYVREIGFYRDLQHEVSIRTPDVLHVGWDPDTHDFVVMMEDIRAAEQGDQLAGCSVARAELVVDQAVGLHAPTWGRDDELRRYDWLGFPDAERSEFMHLMVTALFPGFAERYADRLAVDDLATGSALIERYPALSASVAAWADRHGGWCVVHGDYRLDNILFGTDSTAPPVTVVDWQTVTGGIGPADIAYFCGAGLLPAARGEHERSLVARYGAGVRAAGVDVDDDALWEGYVLGSAGGLIMAVLASQIVERTDRGDEMFAVMAERHAAQIRDVELLDRL